MSGSGENRGTPVGFPVFIHGSTRVRTDRNVAPGTFVRWRVPGDEQPPTHETPSRDLQMMTNFVEAVEAADRAVMSAGPALVLGSELERLKKIIFAAAEKTIGRKAETNTAIEPFVSIALIEEKFNEFKQRALTAEKKLVEYEKQSAEEEVPGALECSICKKTISEKTEIMTGENCLHAYCCVCIGGFERCPKCREEIGRSRIIYF